VTDKYGLAWQVTPAGIDELFADADPERARRAMEAMLKMSKLDLGVMKAAAEGTASP
jgi:predicted 3-demethylubiquinone-9 3-methyltransferase (glyoxalase superfamily)